MTFGEKKRTSETQIAWSSFDVFAAFGRLNIFICLYVNYQFLRRSCVCVYAWVCKLESIIAYEYEIKSVPCGNKLEIKACLTPSDIFFFVDWEEKNTVLRVCFFNIRFSAKKYINSFQSETRLAILLEKLWI